MQCASIWSSGVHCKSLTAACTWVSVSSLTWHTRTLIINCTHHCCAFLAVTSQNVCCENVWPPHKRREITVCLPTFWLFFFLFASLFFFRCKNNLHLRPRRKSHLYFLMAKENRGFTLNGLDSGVKVTLTIYHNGVSPSRMWQIKYVPYIVAFDSPHRQAMPPCTNCTFDSRGLIAALCVIISPGFKIQSHL